MAETITAISTAPGEAGIGIVRTSGPASLEIMKKLMAKYPGDPEPRHAYLSRVVYDSADPGSEAIDQAIFIYMKAPNTYTGEDVLEIQAHGSNVALRGILRAVLESGADGIRMAEPGEFTKLAFLNGKMDLSQAEAVIDIIKAKTDLTLGIAESQREGRLGQTVREIRSSLLDILAEMAVSIDYPDEDEENTGDNSASSLANQLRWVLSDVEELLDTASIGRIAREGVRAVIIGKPNAGKSSLMNAILGEGRVIVTDIPGTTRDTVEETANINGIPIVLVDTAGLRETDDKVEKIGIERTEQAIASADLVMLMLDGSRDLDDEDDKVLDYIKHISTEHLLVIINKDDLGQTVTEEDVQAKLPGATVIRTSLMGKAAVEAAHQVAEAVGKMHGLVNIDVKEMNIITNERHAGLLRRAVHNLDEAISLLKSGEPLEVAELSAHYAYDELGKIIGEEAGEEVINTVFSKFCLGK
ncbi:MAG: tRNA uridine-5-carboxymethylaminomethyl(34) synthesis GTPase MnmE [Mogibacterium sp.]|nr:tRNA uridine-5-carboxymethylaminomethyl(34) synthesis GTPase MnmE [Mogibacterium sp.]